MRQILVLQNQRLGDTLQTTPMLVGLREKHRPCHITLVANRLFADLELGSLVDEVIYFDQNLLYESFVDPALSLREKYDRACAFLEPLRSRRFDLVVDVPADTCMHLIASSLDEAGEVRGVVLSFSRSWRYTHREGMLLYTIGLCREVNRFNLVDLQNLFAGVRPPEKRLFLPLAPHCDEAARRLLAEQGLDADRDVVVALQPGASEERKRWGTANFARLAHLLAKELGARVVVCGSAAERPLGEQIERNAGVPIHLTMGRTGIAELAALIRLSRVLVTNDTGTMHVAAAVGTPIIDLSTGPVYFRETGPYAEGSLVLEADMECSPCNFNAVCRHYSCRDRIRPEMVRRLAGAILGHEPLDSLRQQDFRGVRLHRATFNDVGRIEFLPVFRLPLDHYRFLGYFYAHTWEVFYGLRPKALEAAALLSEISGHHDLEHEPGRLRSDLQVDLDDLGRIQQGLRAGADVLFPLMGAPGYSRRREDLVRRLEKFEEIQRRVVFYGRTRPAVRHFTALLEMAVESAAGADPVAAVSSIHDSLRFLLDQVVFLGAHLRSALALMEERLGGAAPAATALPSRVLAGSGTGRSRVPSEPSDPSGRSSSSTPRTCTLR